MIFLIYFILTKLYKDRLWFAQWNISKTLIIMVLGIAVAIIGERLALLGGIWQYKTYMPVIPIFHVALTAVLELATIPLITLYISSKLCNLRPSS